jgi:hypothetical protein
MTAECGVVVVVDREYGERLCELARRGAVWIIDTPVNHAAAQKIWNECPNAGHLDGVTVFKSEASTTENALLDELDTIDVHHGSYSADPPYTVLEVIGTLLTERVKAELGQYGFDEFYSTRTGFRAVRPVRVAETGG